MSSFSFSFRFCIKREYQPVVNEMKRKSKKWLPAFVLRPALFCRGKWRWSRGCVDIIEGSAIQGREKEGFIECETLVSPESGQIPDLSLEPVSSSSVEQLHTNILPYVACAVYRSYMGEERREAQLQMSA